jgi:hypothetical protein
MRSTFVTVRITSSPFLISGTNLATLDLTALQAGCIQQPPPGTLIGLEGSVFSTTPVNITFPGSNQSPTSSSKATHKSGLPQGAVIGIAVGLAILLLVTIAILIVCAQKRKNLKRLNKKSLHSPLDSRFGATNITAPTNGAYGNPYAPPTAVNEPFHAPSYTAKELNVLANARTVLEKHHSSPRELKDPSGGWKDLAHTHLANALTNQPGTALPTHQAYIPYTLSPVSPPPQSPSPQSPVSETASDASSDTYQMNDYPSCHSSPKNIPPPLILEPKLPLHRKAPSKQSPKYIPQMQAVYLPSQAYASSPPQSEFRSQSQAHLRYERNRSLSRPRNGSRTRNDSRHRDDSRNRAESRAEGRPESRTRRESRAESRTRADSRAQSRTREESRSRAMEESSRVSPPLLNSQRMAGLEEAPSRSTSRSDGNKRNTVRPGIANTNASKDKPILRHGGLFNFEFAERERIEKERMEGLASITKDSFKRKKKHRPEDATPISAESEEQWPGSY